MSERVLDHETRDPRPRIQNRENKQRFEHHREVIPERHHGRSAQTLRENVRHADRKCRSAPGPVEQGLLANGCG